MVKELMICPKGKGCKISCNHREPHEHRGDCIYCPTACVPAGVLHQNNGMMLTRHVTINGKTIHEYRSIDMYSVYVSGVEVDMTYEEAYLKEKTDYTPTTLRDLLCDLKKRSR